MTGLVAEVISQADGCIVVDPRRWDPLRTNVRDLVNALYLDAPERQPTIRLSFRPDEAPACMRSCCATSPEPEGTSTLRTAE